MKPLLPSQNTTVLTNFLEAQGEQIKVVPLQDNGRLASVLVTLPAVASITQADYIHFQPAIGGTCAIYMNIDSNNTPPTGAIYVAANATGHADISTGGSADAVKTAFISAVNGASAGLVAESYATGIARVYTQYSAGTLTVTPKNADDTGAGSLASAAAVEYTGVSSNNFATYITLNSPTVTYYAWFDVNDTTTQGDPAPGGLTAIRVDLTLAQGAGGISVANILSAMKTAIDAVGSGLVFKCDIKDNQYLVINCLATGSATNAGAGTSSCTVTPLIQGHSVIFSSATNVGDLSTTSISAITGV